MKFSAILLSNVLLASAALAAPPFARKRSTLRSSHPYTGKAVDSPLDHEYDSNWAGAAFASPPSGSKFTSVTGTFNVPTVVKTNGRAGAAWVGIDGFNTDSILQTGIQWEVEDSEVQFSAWHEWYPADSVNFPALAMSPGDEITVTVVASSSTSGTATVENTSTGKSVSKAISGQALAGQNAEWIVEDFEEGSSLVPFANFGTITFTGCSATTNSGTTGLTGADTVDIEQNNNVLTSTTIDSSSKVAITYE